MSKGRRIKPSTVEGRRRKTELGEIISNPRTPKSEREAAIRELNILAPFKGSGSPSADTTNEDGSISDRSPVSPNVNPEGAEKDFDTLDLDEVRRERHRLIQLQWSESNCRSLRQRCDVLDFRREVLLGRTTLPRSEWQASRDAVHRSNDEFAALYTRSSPEEQERLQAARYGPMCTNETSAAKPLKDKPTAIPDSAPAVVTLPTASKVCGESEPEAALNPIARAGADLVSRAALVLQTDSWLSRLAQHSEEMRTRIVATLGDELLRVGFVSGDFCARTYNALRPRAVSAFPERKF
jgi:hypothetical protein